MNLTIFALALFSGVLNATWNFFCKKKASNFLVMISGLCIANLTVLPITIIIIILNGFNSHAIFFLFFSSLIEALNYYMIFKMYNSSDISIAYPVSHGTGILFVAILSPVFFGDQITHLAIIGIFLMIIGIFFFVFNRHLKIGQFLINIINQKYALAFGFAIVAYTLIDRVGVKYCNPVVFYNIKQLTAIAIATPFLFMSGHTLGDVQQTIKRDLKYSLIIGYGIISSYLIILMIYNLFAEAKSGYITPIRESSIIIGSILGFVFLKEKVTLNKVLGILIMVSGIILIKIG